MPQHTLGKLIFSSLLITKVVLGRDEPQVIRQREDALAKALNAKDAAILTALTDQQFHVDWMAGSAVRSVNGKMDREEWIDHVTQLPIASYTARISRIDLVRHDEAFVDVEEFWTLRSPHGGRIQRRFHTRDTWFKLQGVWTLTGRISYTDTR